MRSPPFTLDRTLAHNLYPSHLEGFFCGSVNHHSKHFFPHSLQLECAFLSIEQRTKLLPRIVYLKGFRLIPISIHPPTKSLDNFPVVHLKCHQKEKSREEAIETLRFPRQFPLPCPARLFMVTTFTKVTSALQTAAAFGPFRVPPSQKFIACNTWPVCLAFPKFRKAGGRFGKNWLDSTC